MQGFALYVTTAGGWEADVQPRLEEFVADVRDALALSFYVQVGASLVSCSCTIPYCRAKLVTRLFGFCTW
jgi:hypothetical protein